ncbi:MAG: GNAT family N-acetyltransferase [Desulfurivibrionaceae bacterium]
MITIRPIEAQDRTQLIRLVKRQDNFNAQEVAVAVEVIDDTLDPAKNDYCILVAVSEEQGVAGFICYGEIPMTDRRFDLYWVAVDPDLGRKGVGSLLLVRMEEKLVGQGGGIVYVDTSSTPGYDRARSFYEKNGYAVACVLADFYRVGDDRVIYRKTL